MSKVNLDTITQEDMKNAFYRDTSLTKEDFDKIIDFYLNRSQEILNRFQKFKEDNIEIYDKNEKTKNEIEKFRPLLSKYQKFEDYHIKHYELITSLLGTINFSCLNLEKCMEHCI